MSEDFDKKILDIKSYIENKNEEVNNKITELSSKIDKLQYTTSKIGWKFGISAIAVGSLILNILQMIGVF